MIKKLIVSVEKMMENNENFKVLQQFFDETPGAFGRANYIIGCKTRDKPKHNFEANTISRIIPMKEEMEVELTDKSLEELKRELIDKESLNKFLKEEHSKMIKKLIEEDEIFKNNIEGL
uniref:Uncharacterized protein n=1 Tax=Meloidogyne javanica TaxID=6303 RepID=A0A915LDL4_MELJA